MTQINKADKMANWPIPKLLYSMSIPAVFSMMIQALYNIVDTIYVSQISESALFAIGLVFPLQMLIISIALGGGVGTSTLVARCLGAKQNDEANKVAATGLILTGFHYLLIAFIGIFLSKPFLQLFTTDSIVLEMGFEYLVIVMTMSFGVFISVYFERILQAQGNMLMPMFGQLIGAITNIILDPILIFGYFGLPSLGIKGAAIATIIGQIASCLFLSYIMFAKKHDVHFRFKGLHLRKKRILSIYEVGLPVAIMNAIGSVTTTCMNGVLVQLSDYGVTALSIYFKLQSFVFMPCFGFNQGTLPILSYNYGSKNFDRYVKSIKIYLSTTVVIMILGTLLFWFKTDFLLSLFNPSKELLAVSEYTLRIIAISFVIAAISIAMTTIFQSLGNGKASMFMSLARQLIILVPLAFVFGKLWGLNAVWFAYPCAELIVCCIYVPICIKEVKTKFNRGN